MNEAVGRQQGATSVKESVKEVPPSPADRHPPLDLPPLPHWTDKILSVVATGFGLGFFPKAPGTVGSLLGPPLIWLFGTDSSQPIAAILCGILMFVIGIPICNAGVRVLNAKDPKQVVYDEFVAFFWVFLFVPLTIETSVEGFILFRFFDILKPWPIRKVERLPGGIGVMADDALAGLFAGAILGLIRWGIG